MKSVIICGFVLCVLLSSAQSATYYYRIGREVIIPTANEEVVKEVVAAELKKDGLTVDSTPVVADAARADTSPAANLELMEVVPIAGNPLQAATVSETVKNAALEAVRSENAEAEAAAKIPKKDAEPEPVVRQQTIIQQAQETFQNILNNNPLTNAINSIRNPTTSLPAAASDAAQQAASVVADATTARPANPIIQTIQNTLNNLGSAFQRSTTAPSVAAVESDMKMGDENVPIIQQTSNVEPINNKIDLSKTA